MNPLLFRNSKNGSRLIMQVSATVLLPAAMGFSFMEILQCWASEGVEKMSTQANELILLEDITLKMIQEVVSETESRSDGFQRWLLQHEKLPVSQNSDTLLSCSNCKEIESDYACYENLVPMSITNIEALLIEGLKIQSNIPDQEVPSSIKSVLLGGDFLDVDELIEYSVSFEEWLRLDTGDFDIGDKNNEGIVKILAAHQAKSIELCNGQLRRDDESCGAFGKKLHNGSKSAA